MFDLNFIATTSFGLEATVKREAIKLGLNDIKVLDGKVFFKGDESTIAKSNIWFRSADRILLLMGEFKVLSFDELFEKTKALPWDEWISKDGKFTVTGKSHNSKLFSVPDCQAIVKKAVVEKLKCKYKTQWFEETGAIYTIQVALQKDIATITIDTSGPGLHKRGYREVSVDAPLKETMAAALIELSYWKKSRFLLDPLCGSGTIPIEAALIGKNIAPGISRRFPSENWDRVDKSFWKNERRSAYEAIDNNVNLEIFASDRDSKAIDIAKANAILAGVDDCITFETKKLSDVHLMGDYGVCITNPPYGERLGNLQEVQKLYSDMGRIFSNNKTWSVYALTSDEFFEKYYGQPANAKRKLFNGRIKTDYYQYHGTRPPK